MDNGKTILKHIRCGEGDVAPYVIIPGDPGRVARIVEQMDSADFIAENREYVVYTGEHQGCTDHRVLLGNRWTRRLDRL